MRVLLLAYHLLLGFCFIYTTLGATKTSDKIIGLSLLVFESITLFYIR